MITTDNPLFVAILANLEEDVPRLQFADWLDDHGKTTRKCPKCKGKWRRSLANAILYEKADVVTCDKCERGTVPDASDRERAELIRLQHKLASFRNLPLGRLVSSDIVNGVKSGMVRESAILAANQDWTPKCAACDGKGEVLVRSIERGGLIPDGSWTPCQVCEGIGHARVEWQCGFPNRVWVPTIAGVLESLRLCVVCAKSNYPSDGLLDGHNYCSRCDATRSPDMTATYTRPTKYGRYLRDEFPTLRQVMPVDRVPNDETYPDSPCWYIHNGNGTALNYAHWLTPIFLEPMRKAASDAEWENAGLGNGAWIVNFRTTELAYDALGTALRDVLWNKCKEKT